LGGSFETAFLETIVRDRRKGNPGVLALSAADLDDYVHVPVTITRPVNVIDLRGGKQWPSAFRPIRYVPQPILQAKGRALPLISVRVRQMESRIHPG
jgi:hypothetical protein